MVHQDTSHTDQWFTRTRLTLTNGSPGHVSHRPMVHQDTSHTDQWFTRAFSGFLEKQLVRLTLSSLRPGRSGARPFRSPVVPEPGRSGARSFRSPVVPEPGRSGARSFRSPVVPEPGRSGTRSFRSPVVLEPGRFRSPAVLGQSPPKKTR
ncbi:hypothetical protein NHX12_013824 [Muraenolepis orangiensis]|uniref:Uncharacterized protein n=1 Tax=Muraenolepis orangiensis TaxID=630683 RepID=A0A9Q0I366_9TELE|nr:hypothetical protein NHX12_013824 [Muraenolepis orangiensis]